MSTTRYYPTEWTEGQWQFLRVLLPARKWHPGGPGRPPCDVRGGSNGILSLLKTACQWRMLPREFGKGTTIYGYFQRWHRDGVWTKVMEALRQWERQRQGRQPEPSAGSVDSQSIKTARQGKEVGFDGGKKVKGRKRPLLGDRLGLIIAVVVTAANADDRLGLGGLLTRYFAGGSKRLRKLWVDGGYRAAGVAIWVKDLRHTHKIDLEVTAKEGAGFHVIPWRGTVERPFAWLLNDRRHSRDYERLPVHSEALIQLSMIRLLLNRLA